MCFLKHIHTERGWFNGYMRWQIPMRGKNWSDEVQEKLGSLLRKAETFDGFNEWADQEMLTHDRTFHLDKKVKNMATWI